VKNEKLLEKRQQFVSPSKSKLPLVAVVIAIAIVTSVFFFFKTDSAGEAIGEFFSEPVAEPRSYLGNLYSMENIEPVIEDGRIKVPLNEVDKNNIVYFEVENNEGLMVPLMAYITPTGRLFAGSSMCEPCGGRRFSLAGETLVCDLCRTTYTIEDHIFISGSAACGSYPPVYMNPEIDDGMVSIDLDEVLNWRIRTF
jgi:hypothetical protein